MYTYIVSSVVICCLLGCFFIHDYFATKKLKKYMLLEKEKAYLYRDLVITNNNNYYRFLLERED